MGSSLVIKMAFKGVILLLCYAAVTASAMVTDMDQFIEELNQKIPNKQWVAGKNFDTVHEAKGLLGSLDDSAREKVYREGSYEAGLKFQVPDSFDARTEWPDCKSISMLWDQANCGSCWAVAAAGAMSDRMCIHNSDHVLVSPENLMDCCYSCGFGCDGGYPMQAWRYWKSTGIVSGGGYGDSDTCQPYSLPKCDHHVSGPYGPCPDSTDTPKCKHECTSEDYNVDYDMDKSHGMTAYDVRSTVAHIAEELMTNGPVEASFSVYEDFLTYKSGVYEHLTGEYLGGHAVRIIGWGEESGVPYWLVANSWNEGWGDGGHFKIMRGDDECGIESGIVAGMPM